MAVDVAIVDVVEACGWASGGRVVVDEELVTVGGRVAFTRMARAAGRIEPVIAAYPASPGHAVRDKSRWPAMGGTVIVDPTGCLFEPREGKDTLFACRFTS